MPVDINKDLERVRSTIRELYGRVVWTHKTHEKERELASTEVAGTKWINVILTALTFLGVIWGAVSSDSCVLWGTSIIGAANAAFVVYLLSNNPEKNEVEHKLAAKRLLILRERYLVLLLKASSDSVSIDSIISELESISHETSIVYEYAPNTSREAYSQASKALKKDEELTFSDAEIDKFLPTELRRSKS